MKLVVLIFCLIFCCISATENKSKHKHDLILKAKNTKPLNTLIGSRMDFAEEIWLSNTAHGKTRTESIKSDIVALYKNLKSNHTHKTGIINALKLASEQIISDINSLQIQYKKELDYIRETGKPIVVLMFNDIEKLEQDLFDTLKSEESCKANYVKQIELKVAEWIKGCESCLNYCMEGAFTALLNFSWKLDEVLVENHKLSKLISHAGLTDDKILEHIEFTKTHCHEIIEAYKELLTTEATHLYDTAATCQHNNIEAAKTNAHDFKTTHSECF